MKSLLFFMLYHIDDLNKNNTKLVQQMNAAKNLGYDVYFLGYTKKAIYLCNKESKKLIAKVKKTDKNYVKRMQLYGALLKLLKNGLTIDYYYVRKMLPTINYGRCLKKICSSGAKLVVEIPTYPDYEEYEADHRIIRRVAFRILKHVDKHYAKYVDLFALIGDTSDNYFGTKAINIENGIDVNSVSQWKYQKVDDNIHILIVSNFCSWHGYERLVEGIANYYKVPRKKDVYVHFVGPDSDGSLKEWIQMAKKLNVEDNFILEGQLYGEELDTISNKCDFAIAALGLYKKKLSSSSELKILNYCARGIPFAYSFKSFYGVEIDKYCLQLPNNESPVDVESLVSFFEKVRKVDNVSSKLRSFCKNNCRWEQQLTKVFKELNLSV